MPRIDLLLINPNNKKQVYGNLDADFSAIEPPLWTALLAAFVRERGLNVVIIDAVAENLSPEETLQKVIAIGPLVVGIGVLGANPSAASTPNMPVVSKLLALLKDAGKKMKTVLYGIHPSALPQRTLSEEPLDFICRGEVFYTIVNLVESIKADNCEGLKKIPGLWFNSNGIIHDGGWGQLIDNLDTMPVAAWDLLPMDKYRAHNWHCFDRLNARSPYATIYTSLGCPFACTYCNISALYSGKPGIRLRSPDQIIKDIDLLVNKYNIANIKIVDELFVLNEKHTAGLCDLIIAKKYKLNIWAYARIDTVKKSLLIKLKKAGVNWLAYGIESASDKLRGNVTKGQFNRENVKKNVALTHACGINVLGNFMFGLPYDDMDTIKDTYEFAKELKCEYANFYVTMAYPGSRLYEEMSSHADKLPSSWAGYSQLGYETFPLATKYLSSREVLEFRDWAFRQYYSDPWYLKIMHDKFGEGAVKHINAMLSVKVRRKLLESTIL